MIDDYIFFLTIKFTTNKFDLPIVYVFKTPKHRNTETPKKTAKMSLEYCFPDPEDMKPYVDPDDYEDVQDTLNWEVLGNNIAQLPRDIRGKLYIYAVRKYWREFVPETAKVPTWYDDKVETDRLLWNARFNNVHFLHLPFNTVPEYKKYIHGCACGDCWKLKFQKTFFGSPIPWQRIPSLSQMEEGITYWDDDAVHRMNYPGQKINTDFKYKYTQSLTYRLRNPETHPFTFSWEPDDNDSHIPTGPFTYTPPE